MDAWWWTYRGIEPDWKNLIRTDPEKNMDPANFESRLAYETSKLLPFAADVDPIPTLRFTNEDSTAYKVSEVVRMVGYNSPQVFRNLCWNGRRL